MTPRMLEGDDPDRQLMSAFQRGDERCFDQLFDKYKKPLVNFAFRFMRRRDVAEDLAQDVFVKCYLSAASYEPTARFSTWLFRIARNHCLNELRRHHYRHQSLPLDETQQRAPGPSAEEQLQAKGVQAIVEAALGVLPENQRTALLLSREQSMSYEEIAATMETSVSAVKSLLHRAKCTLSEKLGAAVEGSHEV